MTDLMIFTFVAVMVAATWLIWRGITADRRHWEQRCTAPFPRLEDGPRRFRLVYPHGYVEGNYPDRAAAELDAQLSGAVKVVGTDDPEWVRW